MLAFFVSDSYCRQCVKIEIIEHVFHLSIFDVFCKHFNLAILCRCIASLKSLKQLDISGNTDIDTSVAEELLQQLADFQSPLSSLKMTSCGIRNLTEEFLFGCEVCLNLNDLDLSFNEICNDEKQRLVDKWRIVHQNAATCIDHDFCILSSERMNCGWTE